ncbi:hypothetical protein RugamoR64_22360 [Duganella rhizosphaerae]
MSGVVPVKVAAAVVPVVGTEEAELPPPQAFNAAASANKARWRGKAGKLILARSARFESEKYIEKQSFSLTIHTTTAWPREPAG